LQGKCEGMENVGWSEKAADVVESIAGRWIYQ
jgi:hypothetical protein